MGRAQLAPWSVRIRISRLLGALTLMYLLHIVSLHTAHNVGCASMKAKLSEPQQLRASHDELRTLRADLARIPQAVAVGDGSGADSPDPAHAPVSVCVDVLEVDLAGDDDDDGTSTAGVKSTVRFIVVPANATAGELLNAVLNPRDPPGTASPSEAAGHAVFRRGKTKMTALGIDETVLENYSPDAPRDAVAARVKLAVASKRIDAQAWLRTQVKPCFNLPVPPHNMSLRPAQY